jgi:hypothetical protein
LGGNGLFVIETESTRIEVPVENATSEKLAYYGAVALHIGDIVKFPEEEHNYPIWAMSLGKNYVNDYIMTEKAGGWYLEWHTDRPHFHMPLSKDATGVYLLGKKITQNEY